MNVLYFGCKNRGHFLYSKRGSVDYNSTPWGVHLDGGVTGFHQKGGWSAYGFSDYSGDSRPGSNSIFLTDSEVSAQELLLEAFNQWPEIWKRTGFPLTPDVCPCCRREWLEKVAG